MIFFKTNYNTIATLFFVVAILLAHLFSTNNYDWTKNTISHLGAQGYSKKLIMQLGFMVFGVIIMAGIIYNGITFRTTPVLIYGLCVGLTGIFCTKPFFGTELYSARQANIHSALAQIAGVAFTLGILVQFFYATKSSEKWGHLIFFILVIAFSASFGLFRNYQGIFQRLLYITSFIWLIKFYKP